METTVKALLTGSKPRPRTGRKWFSLKHTDEAIIRLPTKAREVNRKNGSKKSARSD
ncbi:hypothetical protein CHCC14527_2820 [Bacillus paralicheniformis]|nr:hypothetical protein CHCC14527_2820 [Bacillus paralicheniformis]